MTTPNHIDEILHLRFIENWKLAEIAKKFGVSRQRIHQIIGNTGHTNNIIREIARSRPDLTNGELAQYLHRSAITISNYRGDLHHILEANSPAGKGQTWEMWTADRLEEMGHKTELQKVHEEFDILVDDSIRVDVKSTESRLASPSDKCASPHWRFGVRKNRRDKTDFYVCVIGETKEAFIIPSSDIPASRAAITLCWPTKRPTMSKWQKYYERWDLITPEQVSIEPQEESNG